MKDSQKNNIAYRLNALYEELAFELNDGDHGNFLSGWQCDNPFIFDFINEIRKRSTFIDHHKYRYFDEDDSLSKRIRDAHLTLDGVAPQAILCASGSTPLLYSFVTYLKRIGIKKIYYIPPIYFTLHIALELYEISSVPVSLQHPFERDFLMELPLDKNSILILTDPVWFTGTHYHADMVSELVEWQKNTSSLVFVDGSLQYLPWDGIIKENSVKFDPSYTFRLICPSKQLCVHGYRFSYLLLPNSHEKSMAWTYANIMGPASADSIAFAHEAMNEVLKKNISNNLMKIVSSRHKHLRTNNIISSHISPDCGYFVFEKINKKISDKYLLIDERYFNLNGYPGYAKINLLSPSIHLLSDFAS